MALLHFSLFAFHLIGAFCTPLTQNPTPAEYRVGNPDRHIVNEYFVHLHTNHTIEHHFQHIGKDLASDAEMFHFFKHINTYAARLDADTLHNLVRNDPGIRLVEHHHLLEREESIQHPETVQLSGFSKLVRRWGRVLTYARWNYAQVALWGKRPTDQSYTGEWGVCVSQSDLVQPDNILLVFPRYRRKGGSYIHRRRRNDDRSPLFHS
jgi:hypothetical protein